jgi:hypothetical protein
VRDARVDLSLRRASRPGLYASPHLLRYNERVRIRGEDVDDEALLQSFNAVEDARHDVPLTYFEFGTLAALWLFARAGLDVLVLEVGLGGRLDAVNVVDADVAVLDRASTSITSTTSVPTREDTSDARRRASSARAGPRCAATGNHPQPSRRWRATWARVFSSSAATTTTPTSARSGASAARAASATDCRFRHCAARISSRMRPRRSLPSICCMTAFRSARRRFAKAS